MRSLHYIVKYAAIALAVLLVVGVLAGGYPSLVVLIARVVSKCHG
jgi:hypothetical protein